MRGKPKLFIKERPTKAVEFLRACAEHKHGLPHPYHYERAGHCFIANKQRVLNHLQRAGWAESGPFGPRNGKRWRLTDRGRAVLIVLDNYPPGPDLQAALTLIGEGK